MKNLKTLRIVNSIDINTNLHISNTTVEFLKLSTYFKNPAEFDFLIRIFKCVKHLEIEHNRLESSNIFCLQEALPNLTSLSLTNCSGDFINHIKFDKLKKFKLKKIIVFQRVELMNLAFRNPSLESLILDKTAIADEDFRMLHSYQTSMNSKFQVCIV